RVELNQVIAEVETAKALVDLPSPYAGVVASLHAEEGQTVSVGEPLVTFEVDDGAAAPPPGGTAPASGAAPAVPDETPAPPAPRAAEPATDDGPEPNLVGYGARPDRVGRPARRPRRAAGETQVSRRVTSTAVLDRDTHGPGGAGATSGAPTRTTGERPRSTPPVRALAKKLGVRIDRVEGTGREGLITREDVLAAVSCHRDVVRPARGAARTAATTDPPAAPALAAPAPVVPSGAPAVPPGGAQTPATGDAGL